MSRLDRVLAAARAWRAHRSLLEDDDEEELAAAIDDLDAFTSKPTDRAMPAVTANPPTAADERDDIPKTDRNA